MQIFIIICIGILLYSPAPACAQPAPCDGKTDCEAPAEVPVLAPEEVITQISFEDVLTLLKENPDAVLVDTRSPVSYESGHMEGAISFPLEQITEETAAETLPKDGKIIVYCQSSGCMVSHWAAVKLQRLGYDVVDFHGGVQEWVERGNKLVH